MTGTQVIPVQGERLCMDLLVPLGILAHRGGKVHPGTTAPPGLVRWDVPATQEPRGGRDLWGRQGSLGYAVSLSKACSCVLQTFVICKCVYLLDFIS